MNKQDAKTQQAQTPAALQSLTREQLRSVSGGASAKDSSSRSGGGQSKGSGGGSGGDSKGSGGSGNQDSRNG